MGLAFEYRPTGYGALATSLESAAVRVSDVKRRRGVAEVDAWRS
jgi:hypothetical protein